jgi:hypothetical protein
VPRRVCDVHRYRDFWDVFTDRGEDRRGDGRRDGGWSGRLEAPPAATAGGRAAEPPPEARVEGEPAPAERRERPGGLRRWLRKVFGGGDQGGGGDDGDEGGGGDGGDEGGTDDGGDDGGGAGGGGR